MNNNKGLVHRSLIIVFMLFILSVCAFAQDTAISTTAAGDFLPASIFKRLQAGEKQTVVVYGTSVTVTGQWAKEMSAYFKSLYPEQVTFINSARSGMHSGWGVENLKERVLDKKPDLVFLEFSINDAATKHSISIEDSRHNLDLMVKALRKHNPDVEIVLQTMNPAWDSPAVPKSYASDRPNLEDYYNVYLSYAADNSLPIVDNYPSWKKIMDEDFERYKKMVSDGIHPHSDPSREVAWPNIKALLDRARVMAYGKLTVPVWGGAAMPGKGAEERESLRSPERTDAIRVTNVSEPTLTLFPAPASESPSPVMIVCPGGGYNYVVVDKEGAEIAQWLNSIGISAVLLKYRVPSNRTGAFQDLQRSIKLVRAKAKEWEINPGKLGVIGFSAGGNLCAKASNLFASQAYEPIDGIDKLSCRPDFAVLVYPAYLERKGEIAADLDLSADIPPTLIVHSNDDDKFVPGSKLYAAALKEKNLPFVFLLYETGGHGYGLRSEREAGSWPEDAEKWFLEKGISQ